MSPYLALRDDMSPYLADLACPAGPVWFVVCPNGVERMMTPSPLPITLNHSRLFVLSVGLRPRLLSMLCAFPPF